MIKARADFRDLHRLIADARRATRRLLDALASRAVSLVKHEAPGGARGRIAKGVTKEVDHNATPAVGLIIASAPVKQKGGIATLHLPGGATRPVRLRAGREANLAELLAEGTGVHGPRGRAITPRRSRVLLIGVDSTSPDESFIESGGQRFVLRPRSSGVRPDDYPGRAASALESEIESVADDVLSEVFF